MEFLRSVEDDLRALSVEARKKHPVVKEAAERGIVKLRALREQYAAAVRESGESLPASRLRSQELLRPFLLACNHADCSKTMILHALGAIAHLMNKDAINPLDAPNILRVLAIQAVSPTAAAPDVHVKVLQTLLLTITWRSCDLPEDMLASALVVCIQLTEHRNTTVRNAAQATLRQIVSLMFDRVADLQEEGKGGGGGVVAAEEVDWSQVAVPPSPARTSSAAAPPLENEDGTTMTTPADVPPPQPPGSPMLNRNGELPALAGMRPVERCAYYLIQDLCLICRGEQGTWIRHMRISPILGMELIEQVISQRPALFRGSGGDSSLSPMADVYGEVLRNQVCPLIVQTLRSDMDFPLLVRLMRTISTVLGELADTLIPQCEVILAMLFQLLSSSELLDGGKGEDGGGGSSSSTASSIASTANSLLGAAVAFGAGAVGVASGNSGGGGRGGGGGVGGSGASGRLGLWTVMLALDVLSMVCGHSGLVQTAFQNYDLFSECTNVLAGMIKGLSRFVVEGSLTPQAVASFHAAAAATSWNAKGLPHLSRGYELMKEGGPPAITEGEVLLNGAGCLLALVETVWGIVLDNVLGGVLRPAIPSAAMYKPRPAGKEAAKEDPPAKALVLHQMLVKEDVWQDILRFFTHLFTNLCAGSGPSCDRLFENSLVGLERFCLTLGVLGVVPAENQMISLATKLAVPALSSELASASSSAPSSSILLFPTSPGTLLVGGGGGGGNAGGSAGGGGASSGGGMLTARHFKAIRGLLRLVSYLGNGLRAKSWETVVEAFDRLDARLYSITGGGGAGGGHSAAAALAGSSLHIIPTGVERVGAVEEHKLANALRRFVTYSAILEDESLVCLVQAYISHGEALLQAEESAGQRAAPSANSLTFSASLASALMPGASAAGSAASGGGSGGGNAGNAPGPGFAGVSVLPERSSTAAAFVLRQLVQIAAFNIFRFELVSAPVASYLSFVASTNNTVLRVYAVASLADLVIRALGRTEEAMGVKTKVDQTLGYSKEEDGLPLSGGSILGSDVEAIFHVKAELERLPGLRRRKAASSLDESESASSPQIILLQPLAALGASPYLDTREHVLTALYRILQSCGHVLDKAWPAVFDLLCAVALSGGRFQPPPRPRFPSQSAAPVLAERGEGGGDAPPAMDATASLSTTGTVGIPPLWGDACLPLAFRSLKLIVDDNLDSVPRLYLHRCVTCIGAFGAQRLDVNVSLTALGMVWTLADFISRPSPATSTTGKVEDEHGLALIWDTILDQLGSRLALDGRPEVRNCAVNTLFSCFVSHGATFPLESWKGRVGAVTVLVEAIEDKASTADDEELGESSAPVLRDEGAVAPVPSSKKAPKVVIHHSRDTAQKQWSETRVLAMQGLGRLHRAFFRSLWSQPWYPDLWTRTLKTAQAAVALGARPPNAEVALAGVGLLFLLLQLASKAGLVLQGPLRAATGMKVVDGALQHADGATSPERRVSIQQQHQQQAFDATKAELWEETWGALRAAVESYTEDQDGEIAAAFVMHLQTTYEGGKAIEFQGIEHTLEYLGLAKRLVEARKSLEGEEGRSSWRPPVLPNQREVLNLLKTVRHEDPQVWELVFTVLTQYAVPKTSGNSTLPPPPSAAVGYLALPVSAQFGKEAADCLTELYDQEHVPMAARAVAFGAIVTFLGDACIQCTAGKREAASDRAAWVGLLSRFAAREDSVKQFLPAALPAVCSSGGLLRPVLRQGMAAAKTRVDGAKGKKKGKAVHLGQAWQHALWVVEGYLIPWGVGERAGQAEQLPLAQLQEEAYTTVGVDMLRALVDVVAASVDEALKDGVVDQLVDLLLDALLAQGALSGAFVSNQEGEEGEAATTEAKEAEELAPRFVFFKIVLEYLHTLLDALVAHVTECRAAAASVTKEKVPLPKAAAAVGIVIKTVRRLVAGMVYVSRWLIERYLTESKCSNPSTQAYFLTESHVLILLQFLQSIRLPDWSLPLSSAADKELPGWVVAPQGGQTAEELEASSSMLRKLSLSGSKALDASSAPAPLEAEEAEEDELSIIQSQEDKPHQCCGHVFLLAAPILSCMGGSSSSVVRTAAMELLIQADLTATFLDMREEILEQRRALHEMDGEVASLRAQTSRLSVSSVAGFF